MAAGLLSFGALCLATAGLLFSSAHHEVVTPDASNTPAAPKISVATIKQASTAMLQPVAKVAPVVAAAPLVVTIAPKVSPVSAPTPAHASVAAPVSAPPHAVAVTQKVATPTADFTQVAVLKKGNAKHPTQYSATPQIIIAAITKAAEIARISLDFSGAVAILESIGGNSNAQAGGSLGLYQIQHDHAGKMVAEAYGAQIADALSATHNPKYADVIDALRHNKLPSKIAYNEIILDPYFNALFGNFGLKMAATDAGLSTSNPKNWVKIYSRYMSGHEIDPGQQLLSSKLPQSTIESNPLLGNTTMTNAYNRLMGELLARQKQFRQVAALPLEAVRPIEIDGETAVFDMKTSTLILPKALADGTQVIAGAESGHDGGENNPSLETVANIGPAPEGRYTVSKSHPHQFKHSKKFVPVMTLTPSHTINMHDRDGFLMHQQYLPDGSHGCVVFPKNKIGTVIEARDDGNFRKLEVTRDAQRLVAMPSNMRLALENYEAQFNTKMAEQLNRPQPKIMVAMAPAP